MAGDIIKVPVYIGGQTDRHKVIEMLSGQVTIPFPDIAAASGGSASATLAGLKAGMKVFVSPATGGMVLTSDKIFIAGAAATTDTITVTAVNAGAAAQSAQDLVYDIFAIRV